jgi:hypothetical protein
MDDTFRVALRHFSYSPQYQWADEFAMNFERLGVLFDIFLVFHSISAIWEQISQRMYICGASNLRYHIRNPAAQDRDYGDLRRRRTRRSSETTPSTRFGDVGAAHDSGPKEES